MDRLAAMQAFIRVADEGSFTIAAERLAISKSVVSKQIQALERHLGVRLFNRSTRQLHLTEPGIRFYERASRIIEDLADAERTVADLQARPRGRLCINVPVSFALGHLSPALPEFLARYPELSVDVTLGDRFVDLVEEGYDLSIRISALEDSSLIARRIAPCESWVCASPDYLARHGHPSHPRELATHHGLIYAYARPPREWQLTAPDGTVHRVPVTGRLRINNGEMLVDAARAGTGIIVTPDFIAYRAVRAGELVRLFPDHRGPELAIHAVYPYTRHVPAKVRAFIDFLLERFGNGAPPWAWERINDESR